MKKLYFLMMLVFLSLTSLQAQHTLSVEIKGLRNSDGSVAFELRDGNDNFVKGISKDITNKKCTITIKNLKKGKYSFKYFHDENNNKELDTNWLGVPKEGYGFSNDASGMFGPPPFEETIFSLYKSKRIKCDIYYIY